jgi:hypothetical protein
METVRAFLEKAKDRLKKHEKIRNKVEHSDYYELALESCSDAIAELDKLGLSNKKFKAYKTSIDEKGACRTKVPVIIRRIEEILDQRATK